MAVVLMVCEINLFDTLSLLELTGMTDVVSAEATYDVTKFDDISAMSLGRNDFAEYSRCYANDTSFAAAHCNDEILLNPTGYWKLEGSGDDMYVPLGTAASPFCGTIRINQLSAGQSFLLLMDVPFFNVVCDSTKIYGGATGTSEAELEFIRISGNSNPLMANEIRHDATEGSSSALWKTVFSSQSIVETLEGGTQVTYANSYSYGGVIGKMMDDSSIMLNYTDNSTNELAMVKRGTAQGILCGEMNAGSTLTATYSNATNRQIVVGDGTNAISGGLVGHIKGATFELTSGTNLYFSVNSGNSMAGLVAGKVEVATSEEETKNSVIKLPDAITFKGTVTSTGACAGGLVGSIQESDVLVGTTGTGSLTLNAVKVSGTNSVGGVIGYFAPSSNASNALKNITYNLTNCEIGKSNGNNPGGVFGEYVSVGGEEIDVSKFVFSGTKLEKGSAGGVFGKYTANGNTTISGTFSSPESSVHFGGVIGQYVNSDLSRALLLKNLTINNVKQTGNNQKLGGIVLNITGSSYVKTEGSVSVNVIGGDNKSNASNPFGGIVSTLGETAEAGSFIDVTGSYSLTTSNSYNGGAIAGSFKNGVLRLSGTTDLSGAKASDGYGQLIYENDTTLVYAKGSGSDENWKFKRNDDVTASDLGQWGEVVRLFSSDNAEAAGIVSVNETTHKVTVAKATPSITNAITFGKLALNMQLNDGVNHGALCFTNPETPTEEDPLLTKTELLASNAISVSGSIDLSGTGLLSLMRDGGNGADLQPSSDTFQGSPDFFTGTITGSNSAEIKLAVGEGYGCDSEGTALTADSTGGRIYVSNNCGHDAQGLLSFGKGASISALKISGTMHVSRSTAGSNHLYLGALFGAMTNGASLSNVEITTKITADKTNDSKYFIGGVSGSFDGDDSNNEYALTISGGKIKPEIMVNGNVKGSHSFAEKEGNNYINSCYVGGVLGLLKGADDTRYGASLSGCEVSPKISLGSDAVDVDDAFIGGVIGYISENSKNERKISISTVTMSGATVEQRSKYSGGLLGAFWDRTQVSVNGLTISSSKVDSKYSTASEMLSGLVYRATGNWNVNALSISGTEFKSASGAPANFGLIVNEGYHGDYGLYLNLRNSGYSLSTITLPSSTNSKYYVDEIVAKTASSESGVVAGGKGVGIININMNTGEGTDVKVTDTGTYQNKTLSNNKLIANQHSRYYYNLDVIKAKESPSDGEKFLMWSIYNYYAASNIKGYGVLLNASLSGLTAVDLKGLSYYPVNISSAELPAATYTFGFSEIVTLEENAGTPDGWARYPSASGDMTQTTAANRRNQHYLMQNSMFINVTGTLKTKGKIIFAGNFGGIGSAGILIGGSLTGTADLSKGVTLNNVKPSTVSSPMLIKKIDGVSPGVNPQLTLKGVRLTGYPSESTPIVASALIDTVEGTDMKIVFSDIRMDARNGVDPEDSKWNATAASNMNTAYRTTRSIFGDATLIKTLKSDASDTVEYFYTWDEDWGKDENNVTLRNVTYGYEVNLSGTYGLYYKDEDDTTKSGERRYSGSKSYFTNPVDGTNKEFFFDKGFLPYVKNRTTDATYTISEVKVNYVSSGLVTGCGTYNDPYVISSYKQLLKVANYINSVNAPLDQIRLPNELNASWHGEEKGDSLYDKGDSGYQKNDSNDTNAISGWSLPVAREYLAGAYYLITSDIQLGSDFPGIGKGGSNENGKTVFHGVIVGQKKEDGTYPTITNYSINPFIYISNGSVIKNLNFKVDNATAVNDSMVVPITITQDNVGGGTNGADYTYSFQDMTATGNKAARYYGGIFGEIMGGDNVIDGVTVTYTANRPIVLDGNNKQLIACGGFVGAIVNGGLIFRGTDSVTGFTVYNTSISNDNKVLGATDYKNLYANPYVGRVINGYAVNEGSSTLNNTTKHYTIDSITTPTEENKLDVSGNSINVPNAQALFVMSLITQSTSGTAVSVNGDYGVSQSYGINNSVFCGSNRLGAYADVGKKREVEGNLVIYTTKSDIPDYNNKAINDVANATDDVRKTAVPYIISAYTKAVSGNYPARTITYDKTKFWDITLSANGSFDLSVYPSFRGIGCMGNKATIYNMKIGTFNGNGRIIKLNMLESRYGRNAENYFHQENYSSTTVFAGETLDAYNYGHDQNLYKLMGFGLFDNISVKNDSTHQYQFQNFTLSGSIDEKVYNSSGVDITGIDDQSQLFCIGGVIGKRVNYAESNSRRGGDYDQGNKSDLNFKDITFDGLKISGSYSCGGLIGIDALNNYQEMKIVNCNSTTNGVEVTGGFYGRKDDKALRHGVGSFVGMTFLCRPIIDGDNGGTDEIETAIISVAKVDSYYTGDETRCNVGGLIGYSGTGATIKNVILKAANENSVIGSEKATNASGFVAFAQYGLKDDQKSSVYIENCTLENISVKARNSASGFYGRCNNESYGPRYIFISNCAVIGNGNVEIKAYGNGTTDSANYVGGLVACSNATNRADNVIQNSYITGYTIEGYYVGGVVGRVVNKPLYLKNVYVDNCKIITYKNDDGYAGGLLGYSGQNLSGYNLKINNLTFKRRDGSDNTSKSGAFIGNANSKIVKFIAIAKYHSDASKVPSADIKAKGSSGNNILVFADYTGQSALNGKNTQYISSFGKNDIGKNITDQTLAPYLTINPSTSLGVGEYISGDAACQLASNLTGYGNYSSGKSAAVRISDDYFAETQSNRAYSAVSSLTIPYTGSSVDAEWFENRFKQDDLSGEFKVSTWNKEVGEREGVGDFTLLVINDANDPEHTTYFIDNYIRLMTNTGNYHYMGDKSGYYRIVVTPCRYNSTTQKFELRSDVACGLNHVGTAGALNSTDNKNYTNGYYQMSLANADSKYDDQFTLIDVQFYDPTDTAADKNKRIAYHLYVPVYTRKTVNIEFSAASISGSEYKASNYINRITSERASGKNANDPTQIIDSMEVWTTTYIRYTYPADQVNEILKLGSDLQWNHDKKFSIVRTRENNIPDGTKMVLLDPNNDSDKVYYSSAGEFTLANDERVIDLSKFNTCMDKSGNYFHEQTLYSLLYDKVTAIDKGTNGSYNEVTSGTTDAIKFSISGTERYFKYVGTGGQYDLEVSNPISEDYYVSLYVPKASGQADVIRFQPSGSLNTIDSAGNAASGNMVRATVTSKLNAALIIGDFYNHTVDSFVLNSELNSNVITESNNTLTAISTATIELVGDAVQKAYFAGVLQDSSIHLYHSFNIQMIRYDSPTSQKDVINGIEKNNISATYSINGGTASSISSSNIIRETSYIQCTTGDIKSELIKQSNNYKVVIVGVASMEFVGYLNEFPSNTEDADGIGVKGMVRSNMAYRESDLPYSKMYDKKGPVAPFYYTKEDNSALFSFDAVDELDYEERGRETKNNSKLGVNNYFTYGNVINGKTVYNAMDVRDYLYATSIEYTVELFRKTTINGETKYMQVNIPDYISDVSLVDSEIATESGNLTKTIANKIVKDKSGNNETVQTYVYRRNLDLDGIDQDAIFYADFSCNVLKDDHLIKKEYANYKIQITVKLNGATDNEKSAYIIYTFAKIDPTMIDEPISVGTGP